MGAPAEIGIDDTKYLNRVSAPGLVIFPVEAENGRIQFDVEMEPNEIDYIHITYKFS